MGVINNITRDSASELQNSASALESLQTMTSALRDSVSDFTLPGQSNKKSSSNVNAASEVSSSRVSSNRARSKVPHV